MLTHKKALTTIIITILILSSPLMIQTANAVTQYECYSSSDSGCTVNPSGTTLVNEGSSFSVNYEANTGYVISGVEKDGVLDTSMAGTTGGAALIGNIHESHTIAVYSEIQTFTISAIVIGDGYITPSGDTTVNYGESQEYTFAANPGSYFFGVFIDDLFLYELDYTFTDVTSDHTIQAIFETKSYTITPSKDSNSNISPSTPQILAYGESKTFTYSAQSGYSITSVLVDGSPLNLTTYPNNYTFSSVDTDHTISVSSAENIYCELTTSSSTIANISATISSYWNDPSYNLSYTIFSTNNTGIWVNSSASAFSTTPSWANATITLNSTIGHCVSYIFYANDTGGNWGNSGIQNLTTTGYPITVSNDTYSQISPSTTVYVPYGGSQNFTFSAEPGYTIESVIINGSTSVSVTSPYAFIDLRGASSIAVSTTNLTYTVNATSDFGSTIYPTGSFIVPAGTWINFTCSANGGYLLDNFYVNGSAAGLSSLTDNQYNFIPTGNTTLHLTSLAVSSGGSGGGGGGGGNYPTVTASPAPMSTSLKSVSSGPSPDNFLFLVGIVAIFVFGVTIVYSRNATKKVSKEIKSWNT